MGSDYESVKGQIREIISSFAAAPDDISMGVPLDEIDQDTNRSFLAFLRHPDAVSIRYVREYGFGRSLVSFVFPTDYDGKASFRQDWPEIPINAITAQDAREIAGESFAREELGFVYSSVIRLKNLGWPLKNGAAPIS